MELKDLQKQFPDWEIIEMRKRSTAAMVADFPANTNCTPERIKGTGWTQLGVMPNRRIYVCRDGLLK